MFLVLISTFFGQCPTCTFAVTFKPPSVEYREVQYTIHQRFLTRCTGCFERTGRSIQPDINSGHQTTGQLHIVVFKEDDLTQEFRTLRDLNDSLDQSLTCTIVRVSLTCEEELYRIIRIVNDLRQAFQIGEQQVSTFVSGKTAAETDQQCIRIDLVQQRYNA